MKRLLFLCLLLTTEFLSQPLFEASLDSVVVEVSRIPSQYLLEPYSLTLIDSTSLEANTNQFSLKEILDDVPGVSINNSFNLSQGDRMVTRGIGSRAPFGVRGIKILLDGIPLTFPDGQSQLNNLNISSIGRIEILRGPNSVLYGNSSGGVILIESDIANQKEFSVSPKINIGSFGYQKYDLGLTSRLFNGSIGLNLYTANFDGFRNHSEANFSGINFITEQRVSEKTDITFIANYYTAPYLLNPSSLNKKDAAESPEKAREFIIKNGAGKEVDQFQSGLSFSYDFTQTTKLTAILYGIKRNLLNAIPNRIIELDRLSYGFRTTLSFNPGFLENKLSIVSGIDYEYQDDTRVEYESNGINDISTPPDEIFESLNYGNILVNQDELVGGIGVFSKLSYELKDDFIISGGIRYDSYSFQLSEKLNRDADNSGARTMDNLSPFLGGTVRLENYLIFFINYSGSFQTPTTNELSNNPYGPGGFNNSLNPETIRSYETGLRGKFRSPDLNYELVFYFMTIEDMLIPYQNSLEETFYRNSGESKANGIELLFKYSPVKFARLSFSYSYQNVKFTDFEVEKADEVVQLKGNRVPGIPMNTFNAELAIKPFDNLKIFLSMNSVDEHYTNDFNGPSPGENEPEDFFINDGYTVFDFSFTYTRQFNFGDIKLSGGVSNLFDKRYNGSTISNAFGGNFFEPAAGRIFFLSIKYVI